ncbi:hypothetical protein L5515_009435 [Caenorhabditis briggsae]|uniref:C-type lectin domain-containing protein n=1 Tax=Caenorhabditis briggsae TaxID=6238 RepID=A0AAE9JNP5_CAEBR|nr:hypothetical protein L5515_009435 [Caenorhabditis briggsae]
MNILILALLFVVTATARFQRFDSSESSWSSVEGRRLRPPSIPQPPGPPRPPGRPLLPSSGCPREWMTFERTNGVWCVMVGHSTTSNGSMSQPEAEAICVRHGATLTGFQNDIERVTVAAEAFTYQKTAKFNLLKIDPCPSREFFTSNVLIASDDPEFPSDILYIHLPIIVTQFSAHLLFHVPCTVYHLFIVPSNLSSVETQRRDSVLHRVAPIVKLERTNKF